MRKLYLILLSLLLSSMSAMAFVKDNLSYTVLDEAAKTVSVAKNGDITGDLVIPSQVENNGTTYTVTEIGNSGFESCKGIISVAIPESVNTIGEFAFSGCEGLTSITIPESVNIIGRNAFIGCMSLASINIPNGVTTLPYGNFIWCTSLTSIIIPESVTSIEAMAFYGCNILTTITISQNVTSIGDKAFGDCYALETINCLSTEPADISETTFSSDLRNTCVLNVPIGSKELYANAEYWKKFKHINEVDFASMPTKYFVKDNLFYTVIDIEVKTLSVKRNGFLSGELKIPSQVEHEGIIYTVTEICESGLFGCSGLTSVEIPQSVSSIGQAAFMGCSGLTSIDIPKDVSAIGSQAFENCSNLTSVNIPNGVTSIEYRTFYDCSSLTSVSIPRNVASIGSEAFENCSALRTINCYNPEPPRLSDETFLGVDKEACVLNVPEESRERYANADYWKEFTHINGLEQMSFVIDNLKYTVVNEAAKAVSVAKAAVIAGDLVIPSQVEYAGTTYTVIKIADFGFFQCPELTSVVIPSSVTAIGIQAFTNCPKLAHVNIPDGITVMSKAILLGCSSLTEVKIPDGVTSIGAFAFDGCSGLTTINIPKKVTEIGARAFADCSRLTSIEIPDAVIQIGTEAFSGCSGLTNVAISGGLVKIGLGVFMDCTSLTSVKIPESVSEIGNYAFAYCENLAEVKLPENLTAIGMLAFQGCSSLKSVVIPKKVTTIGQQAFALCSSLTDIDIPDGVTALPTYVFHGCSALKAINCHNPEPPAIADITTFNGVDKDACVLNVPVGSKELYANADYWKEFFNIKEVDFTGIETVGAEDGGAAVVLADGMVTAKADGTAVVVYTPNGMMVENRILNAGESMNLASGTYILRVNGKPLKVLIR